MTYNWTDNPTEAGVSEYSPDVLNENLMHLKYDNKSGVSIGLSSTASATAEKAATVTGFTLTKGAVALIAFTNANTAAAPTLNINAQGAKAIYSENGTVVSATNPAYFPAGCQIEFVYNGTNWVYKNRVVINYVNGTSFFRGWANGFKQQKGEIYIAQNGSATITFYNPFSNTDYVLITQFALYNQNIGAPCSMNIFSKGTSTATIQKFAFASTDMWLAEGY